MPRPVSTRYNYAQFAGEPPAKGRVLELLGDKLNALIWTEVFGCGAIAGPVLESFVTHHALTIAVFGTPSDLSLLPQHERIRPTLASIGQHGCDWRDVERRYRSGHNGTAHLWTGLVKSGRYDFLIHVDSDQVFLGNAVDDVIDGLKSGAAVCGPRREQAHNRNGRSDVRSQDDTVATFCFGFDSRLVPDWPRWYLRRAIEGRRVGPQRPLDFFDPVVSAMHARGLRVEFLDSPEAGMRSRMDPDSDFLRKILSMPSAAATGCALDTRGQLPVSGYQAYALANWHFFASQLLGHRGGEPAPSYPGIEAQLARLDRDTWTMRDVDAT